MIQDPTGADAEWCFITQDLTKDEYERLYPDASVRSIQEQGVGDPSLSQWLNENTVRIAEYFCVHREPATLNLYPDGLTAVDGSREDKVARLLFGKPTRTRRADRKVIKWIKTNGFEILEEQDWPGKWIPVVRVVGNEFEIDGELHISGLIRNAKDAQRMYNYWTSQEAEMLALAPKAPFIGYGGQFEGYEGQWKTANVNNWPYLEVNADATDALGNPLPLPQRAPPPLAQTGLIQAKMGASDDIKSTTGQYDSSLGATSNERSGKAILAREKQGDTGTYHYVDNLARAIRHVTRQCIDLIPKIYDTARIARTIGLDGDVSMVRVDPAQAEPVRKIEDEEGNVIEKIYNPGVGKYDVVAVTGPGYMTKRQEAAEGMQQVLQGNPALWAIAGDLFVKNMDWPGAHEMAERLRKSHLPQVAHADAVGARRHNNLLDFLNLLNNRSCLLAASLVGCCAHVPPSFLLPRAESQAAKGILSLVRDRVQLPHENTTDYDRLANWPVIVRLIVEESSATPVICTAAGRVMPAGLVTGNPPSPTNTGRPGIKPLVIRGAIPPTRTRTRFPVRASTSPAAGIRVSSCGIAKTAAPAEVT